MPHPSVLAQPLAALAESLATPGTAEDYWRQLEVAGKDEARRFFAVGEYPHRRFSTGWRA